MVAKVLRAHIYKSENRKRIGQQLSFIMASSNIYPHIWGGWYSQVAQAVKNLLAMWEIWVRSLRWEDPLDEGMATHSSILAWRLPWTEQSTGSQRVGHN